MTAPTQTRVLDRLALVPTLASLVLALSVVIFVQLSADRLAAAAVVDPVAPVFTIDPASLAMAATAEVRLVDLAPEPGPQPVATTVVAAVDADDRIVGLATLLGGAERGVVNNWSTAATLMYWTDLVQAGSSDSDRLARLDAASQLPTFEELAIAVTQYGVDSSEVVTRLAELVDELHTATAVDCGVVCAEAVTGAFYTFENHGFVPIALVDNGGHTCGTVPGAAAPVTGGLIRSTEQLLVGTASTTASPAVVEVPDLIVVPGVETVDTSDCDRMLTVVAETIPVDFSGPGIAKLIELLSGREGSARPNIDQTFHDHPQQQLAVKAVGLIADAHRSAADSTLLASPKVDEISLGPVPETGTNPGGSNPGTTVIESPSTQTPSTQTPATQPPVTAPATTPTTLAPTTVTSISRIEISMAVSYGNLPSAGTFEVEVTIRNSGNASINAAGDPWRLKTPAGVIAPAIVTPQLSGNFPIPADGAITGKLHFELDTGPPQELTLILSNGVNVTAGF